MRCGLQALALLRSISAQRVLQLVAQLRQNTVGNIRGLLGNKVNTNALGANQAHNLLHLVQQGAGSILKDKMCFVKEEDHLGLIQIACLRHHFVKLGEHP